MTQEIRELLQTLLAAEPLAVLATHSAAGPHASLVAFAPHDGIRELVFVTPRGTRKFANLLVEGRAALLIDSRGRGPADIADALAATAVGPVAEVHEPQREAYARLYAARHPHLAQFASAPSSAILRMVVERYSVVRRFQDVTEIDLRA